MTATLERGTALETDDRRTLRENLKLIFPGLTGFQLGTLVMWYRVGKVRPPNCTLDGLCSPKVWANMWLTPDSEYTKILVNAVNPLLRYVRERRDGGFLIHAASV